MTCHDCKNVFANRHARVAHEAYDHQREKAENGREMCSNRGLSPLGTDSENPHNGVLGFALEASELRTPPESRTVLEQVGRLPQRPSHPV